MGQQRTLVYSFVARGTTVLADHAEVSGNFASVAAQCLQKLPSNNNRINYNCDGHTFNYHLPVGFIERVKEDFSKKYSGGKAKSAAANGLKREYGPKLKEHMRYCDQHPEEIDKLAKVKAQVTEVKGVMMQNIEKAQDFRQQGTKIRRKMWWENMKMKLIVFGIVVALILLIVLTVCKDFNCW
nr:unnamed protein product [Digitaria exilis]